METRIPTTCILAAALVSCGSPEFNAFTTGVTREDAIQIRDAIRAQLHVKDVYQYSRSWDGSIIVSADSSFYSATRVKGRWKFTKATMLLHPAN